MLAIRQWKAQIHELANPTTSHLPFVRPPEFGRGCRPPIPPGHLPAVRRVAGDGRRADAPGGGAAPPDDRLGDLRGMGWTGGGERGLGAMVHCILDVNGTEEG